MSRPTHSIFFSMVLSAGLAAATAFGQIVAPDSAATAQAVMKQVKNQATAEHKNILVAFGASWCGNCRLFDKFLSDPAIHPIMDKAFVFADLNTGERADDKRHSNIPGGVDLQNSLAVKTLAIRISPRLIHVGV